MAGAERLDKRRVISNEGQRGEQGDRILLTRPKGSTLPADPVSVMPENRLIRRDPRP
jgi:hypothetical protein